MRRSSIGLLALGLWLGAGPSPGGPGKEAKEDKDEKAIVQTLDKFAQAFNAADAAALAALWSETAEYLSEDTGERLVGRKAIEADFARTLDKKRPARLEIDVTKIRRIGGDVAAIEGMARVIRAGEAVLRTRFSALLVRKSDAWLLDSVRESDLPAEDSTYENLKELAWLDGNWLHREEDTEITLTCEWVANGNFRSHRFSVKRDGEVVHEGTQIVGWDPIKKHIRSWVFASDGSFGDGVWHPKEKKWVIKVTGVLPDGQVSAATQIITPVDKDHFTWQVVDRSVGARLLPSLDPIAYGRVTAGEEKKGE